VIEVQFIGRAAHRALRTVTSPHLELDMGWDQPPSLRVDVDRLFKIVITFDCD